MRSAKSARLAVLALLGVLIAAGVQTAVSAAQSSPTFALSISPSSQSVPRGQTATYTVTATSQNGFDGNANPITLSTSGGPTGTTLSTTVLKPAAGSSASSTLSVATTSSTAVQAYTITVNGVAGKTKQSASTGLTVTAQVSPSISLSMTPSSLSVPAGTTGVFSVALSRTNYADDVVLKLYGSPPAGVVSATFDPPRLTGSASSSTLTIVVDPNAKAGTGTVYIVGSNAATGGAPYAYAQGDVAITKPQGRPFTISGALSSRLSPGVRLPLDLSITNPNSTALSVTNLTVDLTGTSSSSCAASNFSIGQYSGAYPLSIPAGSTVALSTLKVPEGQRPQVGMLNKPTNQDACKSVSLSLAFAGTAQGN